jgi:TonB-linked SusC/RagA family outer membrane protein
MLFNQIPKHVCMKILLKQKMVRTFLLHFACLLLFAYTTVGQVRISGTVSDAAGNGLPGITVTVKNTSFATATNADGTYQLNGNISAGAHTLVFTGIGYRLREQSIRIGSESAYTVNTELSTDATGLDEVIVTGTNAGTTKRQLGNFIATVSAEDLTKGVSTNALQALQGKTAGAQIIQNSGDPAGGISVRLRGISSIFSGSDPLYIVDGIIVNNATNRVTNTSGNYDGGSFVGNIGQNRMVDINPADIERIEVLNGAAAAAIYGSRANAGVIQIFTKRGKTGAPQVSFSTNFMTNSLRKKVAVNHSPTKFGGSPDEFTQDVISAIGTPPALPTNTTDVTRYDYNDYIFRTGIGTDNNVSVSGGSDKSKYFLSAAYLKNQGIVKNTDFQRYSLRANIDQKFNDWLSASIGMNYINSDANEKPDGNSFFSPLNSINIIGNFHDIWQRDALGNLKAVGERGRVNPVSIIEDIKQREITNRLLANASLKITPFKNLNISYTIGLDNYSQKGTTFIPPFTYNVNPAFYGGGFPINETQNGYASAASNTFFQVNHDLNANYQVDINDDLISVTQVGYSVQYEKNQFLLAQGRGLAPAVQVVTGASTILPPSDLRSEISISGVYLQQNFKFKNNLFLTGAVRVDGSSVFGQDQRNQVYVKGSGSYVISGTNYWDASWWNLFKIRMAYGQSGNLTGIGPYERINSYSTNAYLGKTALTSSGQLANENVEPERQQELEFGTDLGFLNDRIGVQFNYYIKKVKSLLFARSVAPTTGFSNLLDNIGSLENRGIELMLTVNAIRKKDLNWSLTAIYNRNRNKAVSIGQSLYLLSTNAGAPVAVIEGQPIGVFYGSFFATNPDGSLLVKNEIPQIAKGVQDDVLNYTIDRGDPPATGATTLRKVLGDPNPDYTGSLVSDLTYKKLNLRIQLDAVQGVDIWNADWRTRQGVGNGEVAEAEQMGRLPRGYVTGVYAIEQWRIDDGSFVKLREVSLSYDLGRIKGFNDLSVQLSGRNLLSFDNYKGYDPEVNSGGQSTILRGIDFGSIPIPRTFSIGLSAKF